jgi:putative effector of murein hydrolase
VYFPPKSFLSRLLGAAWTILLVAVLLWLAVHLLAKVWVWIVAVTAIALVVRIVLWWRRVHREDW